MVHHGGDSASGEYVSTVQLVDVATGWSERVAVLGRSYLVMRDAFQRILTRFPFPILEIHPDNGSEFFDHHMPRFWNEAIPAVQLSRSRPYPKRDNRFAEQKNSSLVRGYLGHDRLDSVPQTVAVNRLYHMIDVDALQLLPTRYAPDGEDIAPERWGSLGSETPLRRGALPSTASARPTPSARDRENSSKPFETRSTLANYVRRSTI